MFKMLRRKCHSNYWMGIREFAVRLYNVLVWWSYDTCKGSAYIAHPPMLIIPILIPLPQSPSPFLVFSVSAFKTLQEPELHHVWQPYACVRVVSSFHAIYLFSKCKKSPSIGSVLYEEHIGNSWVFVTTFLTIFSHMLHFLPWTCSDIDW